MVTDHQALAQAIQEYDELNQKTAALPAFRCNRRSYFARFSFIFLERPPVHPLFAVTGGLFLLTHPYSLPKRPPVYPLFAVTGGLFPLTHPSSLPKRPPVYPLFAVTGGLFPLTHPSRLPKRPPVYPLYGVTGGLLTLKALLSLHLPPDFLFSAMQAVNGNHSLATPESCFLARNEPPIFSEQEKGWCFPSERLISGSKETTFFSLRRKKVVFDAGASSEVHGVGAKSPLVRDLRRLLAPAECFSGQAEGQTCPLACCLSHAGGWKCGQGQATRLVVACRGASGPLDGTASCWHPRRR